MIAVHGYGRQSMLHHLLLGGRNRALAAHLAEALRAGLDAPYVVQDDLDGIPKELRGQHERNPVNRPAARGVQLELPPSLRWNRAEWGWSDHAGTGRAPDVTRLIDAMVVAVEGWPLGAAGDQRSA